MRRHGKTLMASSPAFFLFLLVALLRPCCDAQQQYENNAQDNCYGTNASSVLGYDCSNATTPSCTSYLTFRASQPLYGSPVSVAYLLAANATAVAAANAVTTVSPVPDGHLLLVPLPCSCTPAAYYQYNATYRIQFSGETYFIIANNTYQGLSTCQALMAQNPKRDSRGLVAGMELTVPLRCACPSASQAAAGFRFLVSYLVMWRDDVNSISRRFRTDAQAVLDANQLAADDTIYPFTTLLVPVKNPPTPDMLASPPLPPPPPPPAAPAPPASAGSAAGKWVGVGIGTGVGALALTAVLGFLFWRRRRQHGAREGSAHGGLGPGKAFAMDTSTAEYGAPSGKKAPPSPLLSSDVRGMLESLTVYKYEELSMATARFAEERRVPGSAVYRAVINGDAAAVKRVAGDMTGEINILKQLNHSCIVRLSGFCLQHGDTYMVYELAENGALSDWLHHGGLSGGGRGGGECLGWRQRVQAAHDVAEGLNYLHNYTSPPYVHKNLKSSNVLLDGDFRAKLSNFGAARAVAGEHGAHLTRHVVGTQGYLAPEYLEHGVVSAQLDVFAFGVVVLELLSGKEAAFVAAAAEAEGGEGKKREALLWEAAEGLVGGEDARGKLRAFMDPCLQGDYPFDLAFAMAELALRCVARDPAKRPAIAEVLVSLSAVYNATLDWDPSDYSNSGSTVLAR